jgi:hypothetical protein
MAQLSRAAASSGVGKERAMIELTEEQRRRLQDGKAVDVTDGQTNQAYVLLGREVYERVQRLLYDDSDWTDEELRLLFARSAKDNGWDEPGMDDYDRYDEEAKRQCR